jgi:hypothetical protein
MRKTLCATLIATMSLLPLQAARAEMITPGQVSDLHARNSSQARELLASQLQALGVPGEAARARVAALSDEEASALAAQAATAPAGGNGVFILIAIMLGLIWVFNHSLHSK